jgi:hypothetical protein
MADKFNFSLTEEKTYYQVLGNAPDKMDMYLVRFDSEPVLKAAKIIDEMVLEEPQNEDSFYVLTRVTDTEKLNHVYKELEKLEGGSAGSDLTMEAHGKSAVAVGKKNERYLILVNENSYGKVYNMEKLNEHNVALTTVKDKELKTYLMGLLGGVPKGNGNNSHCQRSGERDNGLAVHKWNR